MTSQTQWAGKKLLCVFSTLLGHSTVVTRLTEALNRLEGLHTTYVLVGADDYTRHPAPWWARAADPWHAQFVSRQAVRPVAGEQFDLLFVDTWESVVAFHVLARRLPSAAWFDAVPATINAQFRARGMTGWKRKLSHVVHNRAFARAAREFDLFLPKSSECAEALHDEYGIERNRCYITPSPQHLDFWKPAAKADSQPSRLLFAGNDFARKGGEFLLRLYSEHLANSCSLTIASNDPALAARELPEGVELLRGRNREQLLEVFQRSDVFVFPSQHDFMPEVIPEALAAGLPCVVTAVDGVRDLVRDGEDGFVMPRESPATLWAERILGLLGNPVELRRMSDGARRVAEEKLDFNRFAEVIAEVVGRLADQDVKRGPSISRNSAS